MWRRKAAAVSWLRREEAVKDQGTNKRNLAEAQRCRDRTENKGVVDCKSLRLSVSARDCLFFHTFEGVGQAPPERPSGSVGEA